jgi:hypothetical protein
MSEQRPAGEHDERPHYWPVIQYPDNPERRVLLARKGLDYARRIRAGTRHETPYFILREEYERHGHDAERTLPKTDAYLKLLLLDVLEREGVCDTAAMRERLHKGELQRELMMLEAEAGELLDDMFQSAVVVVDQYASGEREIILHDT